MSALAALEKFVEPFGVSLPGGLIDDGRFVYIASDKVQEMIKKVSIKPFSSGLLLGQAKPKEFIPSFALLDLLKSSENKIVISDDVEWLFICGRDVFMDKIVRKGALKKTFLVCNRRGEVLGLGSFARNGKEKFVKNILDRGNYLHREERKKRK